MINIRDYLEQKKTNGGHIFGAKLRNARPTHAVKPVSRASKEKVKSEKQRLVQNATCEDGVCVHRKAVQCPMK